jgi:hypothetical protein
LKAYADAYEAAYGQREAVADLIPFMLMGFLESDKAFGHGRRGQGVKTGKPQSPPTSN